MPSSVDGTMTYADESDGSTEGEDGDDGVLGWLVGAVVAAVGVGVAIGTVGNGEGLDVLRS
ncbi:MAG TPA: hypothetical protein VGJ28_06835, partial [Micromonosporaceae bacterium]